MNFMIRISNVFLGSFTKFAMNNSMIKKLYSSRKTSKSKEKDSSSEDDNESLGFFNKGNKGIDKKSHKAKIVKEMKSR